MKGTSIIGGELRRQTMGAVPEGLHTRPILARIKKSLFDIIKNKIEGAKFLDLFAGSGSVGLEALSRGASKVIFIDANAQCARWIEGTLSKIRSNNRQLLGLGQTQVCRQDITQGLFWLKQEFDIIFSGAPYRTPKNKPLVFVHFLLENIQKEKLLAKDGWFIAQHSIKETFVVPEGWNFFRQEKYGDTAVSFFKHAG